MAKELIVRPQLAVVAFLESISAKLLLSCSLPRFGFRAAQLLFSLLPAVTGVARKRLR